MTTKCTHPNIRPEVFDQTGGVQCPDCNFYALCWSGEHCSEFHWNLACRNEPEANARPESRKDICCLCDALMLPYPTEVDWSEEDEMCTASTEAFPTLRARAKGSAESLLALDVLVRDWLDLPEKESPRDISEKSHWASERIKWLESEVARLSIRRTRHAGEY